MARHTGAESREKECHSKTQRERGEIEREREGGREVVGSAWLGEGCEKFCWQGRQRFWVGKTGMSAYLFKFLPLCVEHLYKLAFIDPHTILKRSAEAT